jgi:hypothetical protein
MPAPFPINAVQTGIAIAYRNTRLIADAVAPRVPVGKEAFKHMVYDLGGNFTIPDTKVGRKSKPNEASFSATEVTSSTEDFGLDDPIPNSDIENAPEGYDPISRSTEGLTDLILLDREVRVASAVTDASNYATGYKATLSGNDQFSDFTNSDPIGAISDALDAMIMRANQMTLSRQVFSKLARHPAIVSAYNGTDGSKGIVPAQFIADLFGLERVLVGEAFVNTAKKGQTPTMARAWGKSIALQYVDPLADTRNRVTHMITAQFGDRLAGFEYDGSIGLRGGQRNRVGESVKELIVADRAGYLIENAIA